MPAAWIPFRCSVHRTELVGRADATPTGFELVTLSVVETSGAGAKGVALRGSLGLSSEFSGCPSCSATTFVRCGSCGSLGCSVGTGIWNCPWCGVSGEIGAPGPITDVRAADIG